MGKISFSKNYVTLRAETTLCSVKYGPAYIRERNVVPVLRVSRFKMYAGLSKVLPDNMLQHNDFLECYQLLAS